MGYKISKSRKGDGLIWIAREHGKKGVVARAESEEALLELLTARNESINQQLSVVDVEPVEEIEMVAVEVDTEPKRKKRRG